jgi:hypothetical protein
VNPSIPFLSGRQGKINKRFYQAHQYQAWRSIDYIQSSNLYGSSVDIGKSKGSTPHPTPPNLLANYFPFLLRDWSSRAIGLAQLFT